MKQRPDITMTADKNARVVHCHPGLKVEITGYYRSHQVIFYFPQENYESMERSKKQRKRKTNFFNALLLSHDLLKKKTKKSGVGDVERQWWRTTSEWEM